MDNSKGDKELLSGVGGRWRSKQVDSRAGEQQVLAAVNDLSAWKSIYLKCIELRDFEISQLVQRNNFFMIFQGVLFAGVCQSAAQVPVVSFMICLAGFVVSLLQAGMAAGAKYWQEHWEINTRKSERAMTKLLQYHRVLRYLVLKRRLSISDDLLAKLENRGTYVHLFEDDSNREEISRALYESRPSAFIVNKIIMQKFSVGRIPIYVGLCLALVWLVLIVCTLRFDSMNLHVFDFIVGFPRGS